MQIRTTCCTWRSSKILAGIARIVIATAFCNVLLNENRVFCAKLEEKADSTSGSRHLTGECQLLDNSLTFCTLSR